MARRPSWRLAAVVLVALVGISAVAALAGDDDRRDAARDLADPTPTLKTPPEPVFHRAADRLQTA